MPRRSNFLLRQKKLYILFSILFEIYFVMVYIWPLHHSFDQRIWFTVIFYPLKERCSLNFHIFCPSSCYHGQNYQTALQLFWWRIVASSFVLVYQFYCYISQAIRSSFWKINFWARSFSCNFNRVWISDPRLPTRRSTLSFPGLL